MVPLYIVFLAWDQFVAIHDKDGLGGMPQVPGESDPETDQEKLTGIAFKIAGDLVKDANAQIDEDDYSTIRTQIGEFVSEM